MAEKDLFRCLVYGGGVSLTLIDGKEFCKEGLKLQGFAGEKADVFSAALLCTTFLSASLKEKTGAVSACIRTDGKFSEISVSGNTALYMRACVDEAESLPKSAEKQGQGSPLGTAGFMQVVRNDAYSTPFIGACALKYGAADVSDWFAENFEEYFRVSEQIDTRFFVQVNTQKDEYFCAVLQGLPGGEIGKREEAKKRLKIAVDEMKKTGDKESAAKKAFGEIACTEWLAPIYKCNCSFEYLQEMLKSMGKKTIDELIEKDGKISVHCHYCNKDYTFYQKDFE